MSACSDLVKKWHSEIRDVFNKKPYRYATRELLRLRSCAEQLDAAIAVDHKNNLGHELICKRCSHESTTILCAECFTELEEIVTAGLDFSEVRNAGHDLLDALKKMQKERSTV